MSFWTDIRDTITAPARAIGDFVGDVFAGKNIFDSVGQLGLKGANAAFRPAELLIAKTPLRDVFDSDFVSGATFGVSKDLTHISDLGIQGTDAGGGFTRSEALDQIRNSVKVAAVAGGAYAGAAILPGALGASNGLAYTGATVGGYFKGGELVQDLAAGNVSEVLSAVGDFGGNVVPDDLKDAYQGVKDAAGAAGSAIADYTGQAAGAAASAAAAAKRANDVLDLVRSNTPSVTTGVSPYSSPVQAAVSPLLAAAVIGGALLMMRKK